MSTELNNIYNQIQERGFRLTLPRKAIVQLLFDSPKQATELVDGAKKINAKIDKATVYRNLETLMQAELVNSFSIRNKRELYELNIYGHHHHLICKNCNQIIHIELTDLEAIFEKFEKKISQKHNFIVTGHSLSFYGSCKNCI